MQFRPRWTHCVVNVASSGRTAFDTSVLIPALLSWHEHHEQASATLRSRLASPAGTVVPLPAVIETYSAMTRLPPPFRMKPAVAATLIARLRAKVTIAALSGEEAWNLLEDAARSGIAGGATYDLHVLACARKAQAATLVTFNRRDFERFDLGGLELLSP